MRRVRLAIKERTFDLPIHPKLLVSLERFNRLEVQRMAEMERLIYDGFWNKNVATDKEHPRC